MVIELGRLTRENELKTLANENQTKVLRNTIAVREKRKDKDGNYPTNFIPILLYGKLAENFANFTSKGSMVYVQGEIKTGSYKDKETDKTVYTWDVVIDSFDLVESKKEREEKQGSQGASEASNQNNASNNNQQQEDPNSGFQPTDESFEEINGNLPGNWGM